MFNSSQSPAVATNCSFTCSQERDGQPSTNSEFQACFTNNTGSYNSAHCDGLLSHSTHLNFGVQNISSVLNRFLYQDTVSPNGVCWEYDLKDVQFLKDSRHEAHQILCERELTLQCNISCSDSSICHPEASSTDVTFWLFLFLFLISNIVFSPTFALLDAAAYDNLGDEGHKWGQQRLFGTIGFALFAVTSSFIMTILSSSNKGIDFSASFFLFLPLCICAGVTASTINMSSGMV